MSIGPWFERYPEVFEQERSILLEHGFELNEERLAADRNVIFTGSLPVDAERKLTVVFPGEFPSFPPRVFDIGDRPLLRRHHHPGTRQLCLFGLNNARWHAQLTSADVLAEASQLLTSFGSNSIAAENDDVPEPASAVLSYRRGVSILVPPPISSLRPNEAVQGQGTFILRCDRVTKHPEVRAQGIVFSVAIAGETVRADSYYRDLFDGRGSALTGPIILIPKVLSGAAVVTAIEQHLAASRLKQERWLCFLFREQSGAIGATRLAWMFVHQTAQTKYELIETFAYRVSDRAARVPSLNNMVEKKVTIIGCGCLGSKIAVTLAASGIGKLTLVDRERYEPNNSVRHEVDIRHFGQEKVDALADRVVNINPAVEITPFSFMIGGTEPVHKERQLTEELAGSDILVDTTGSHGVSRWINERAFLLGVPAVFVSVTNGAWAGEIVRVIPAASACWLCWNHQYGEVRPPSEPTQGVFPPGCGQPSFTGSTFETGIVADLGTSMVVATLLHDNPERLKFAGDYLRWIGRDEQNYILSTDILPVNKRSGCAQCNPAHD